MTRLMEEALDFARSHIETFYDSDFFPKSEEFEALWGNWDQLRHELAQTNVEKLPVRTPRALPAPKGGGGYRIVHQLDPRDALIYTALAYSVADDIEAARIPPDRKTVFSYRLKLSQGSFSRKATAMLTTSGGATPLRLRNPGYWLPTYRIFTTVLTCTD